MESDDAGPAPKPASRAGRWLAAVVRELRGHAVAYSILVAFVAVGPFVVAWMFPGVTPWVGVVGGLAVGIYAALCAVPDRFYE